MKGLPRYKMKTSTTIPARFRVPPQRLPSNLPTFAGPGFVFLFFFLSSNMAARNDEQRADSWHLPGESAWHGRSCTAQNNKRGAGGKNRRAKKDKTILSTLGFFFVLFLFYFSLCLVASSRQICSFFLFKKKTTLINSFFFFTAPLSLLANCLFFSLSFLNLLFPPL